MLHLPIAKYFVFGNLIFSRKHNLFVTLEDIPKFLFKMGNKAVELYLDYYLEQAPPSKCSLVNELNFSSKFYLSIKLHKNGLLFETQNESLFLSKNKIFFKSKNF